MTDIKQRITRLDYGGVRHISRIDIIAQNGNEGEHYAEAHDSGDEQNKPQPTANINRQTVCGIIEAVARQINHDAERESNSVDRQRRIAQADMLRDALDIMLEDRSYKFDHDTGAD